MVAAASSGLHVCIVEDDPLHTLLITRAITEVVVQAQLQVVNDGETALTSLRTATAPDLILLDINMAGLSGLEVLAEVKADARLKRIPVVMLTSSELPTEIARAYELGASGNISKPSYPHDLRAVLGHTILYWSSMRRTTNNGEAAR